MGELGHIHQGDSSQGVAEKSLFKRQLRQELPRCRLGGIPRPTVAMSRPQLDLQIRSGGPGVEYERATVQRESGRI